MNLKSKKFMIKTEAIILKSADSNEVDRLLIVYSEKLGKINISAKGVKKLESKLRYSIESISWVQMILVEGKNILILKDAVIKDQFLKIKKDSEKLKIVGQIADLIDEAIAGQEKDECIWKLILSIFKNINEDKISLKSAISDFEKNLIKLLGYDPEAMKNLKDIY
ncbi:MAG: DNA repair protein RecO [Candidatus Portnoybacteria bacterium CG10_big_fil_rev_8_21_14_0_10_38_18]|uniref:DNA repair protein RecO n=1 Tax=Candidatus Portnoybacteria bacterium CG10_big_fil_rev_8_21_14_0_10_38_18 TaxID=1974813 RepID=A0A2M8KC94_9BACT|nr:MAG: DNA repair protein RecO [Candidatus Portnoybacteria bacterium CG10_big_fil_rev_8_21_14_0_10_38_18]